MYIASRPLVYQGVGESRRSSSKRRKLSDSESFFVSLELRGSNTTLFRDILFKNGRQAADLDSNESSGEPEESSKIFSG